MKAYWLGEEIDPTTFVPRGLPAVPADEYHMMRDALAASGYTGDFIPRYENGDCLFPFYVEMPEFPGKNFDRWGYTLAEWMYMGTVEAHRRLCEQGKL